MLTDWTTMTLGKAFDQTVERFPAREALVFRDTRLTYQELAERIDSLAKGFIQAGIRPGDMVGIWLPNYPEFVYTYLALAKIGAVSVMVNTRFKAPEVEYALQATDAVALIMSDRFLTNEFAQMLYGLCPELQGCPPGQLRSQRLPKLRSVFMLSQEPFPGTYDLHAVLEQGRRSGLDAELAARQTAVRVQDAVVSFLTSGTTSYPKVVLHNHTLLENISHYLSRLEYTEEDRCLVPMPLFYVAANMWCLTAAFMCGATLLPLIYFTAEEVLETTEKERATAIIGMPSTYISYLELLRQKPYNVSSLQRGWIGGANTPIELIREIRQKLGMKNFVNSYGMTETQGMTFACVPGDPEERVATRVGIPYPGFELRVVDPETGAAPTPGQPGELRVRGRRLMLRYYNLTPEQQAAFFDDQGWFRTGDLVVHHSDGYYSIVGRLKDLIKVGGENVAASEVERVIYQHPGVLQVAAFGVPDARRVEVVAAYVEPRPGAAVDADELTNWCKQSMAPFKVPRYVRFVEAGAWPMTPSGKIKKFVLAEQLKQELKL